MAAARNHLLILTILAINIAERHAELYQNDAAVVLELNTKNFEATVYGTDNAWAIEFYASWCGHCQHFAPHWRQFGLDVKSGVFSQVMKVGAVDCANAANKPLCTTITGFPTVKYFPPQSKSTNDADVIKRDKMIEEYLMHLEQNFTAVKTMLSPSTVDEANVAIKLLSTHRSLPPNTLLLWITDDTLALHNTTLAFYLATDDRFDIRHVRSSTPKFINLKNQIGITSVPSLVIIDKSMNIKILPWEADMAEPAKLASAVLWEHAIYNDTKDQVEKIHSQRPMIKHVNATDVVKAIAYALEQEVPLHPLNIHLLRELTELFVQLIPSNKETRSAFLQLQQWLRDAEGLSAGDFTEFMDTWELPGEDEEWAQCMGSKAHYRGYPCGLWSLFHVLVTGSERISALDGWRTLGHVAEYVDQYFGCRLCANHFLEMYKRPRNSSTRAQGASLWLWNAHNIVNARLSETNYQDPEYPKEVFPSPAQCPDCYLSDGHWNYAAVQHFLLRFYHLKIHHAVTESVHKRQPENKSENHFTEVAVKPDEETNGYFGRLISFCVLLNIASALFCCNAYTYSRRKNKKIQSTLPL